MAGPAVFLMRHYLYADVVDARYHITVCFRQLFRVVLARITFAMRLFDRLQNSVLLTKTFFLVKFMRSSSLRR